MDVLEAINNRVTGELSEPATENVEAWFAGAFMVLQARLEREHDGTRTRASRQQRQVLRAVCASLIAVRDGNTSPREHEKGVAKLRQDYLGGRNVASLKAKRGWFILESDDDSPLITPDAALDRILTAASPTWPADWELAAYAKIAQRAIALATVFAGRSEDAPDVWELVTTVRTHIVRYRPLAVKRGETFTQADEHDNVILSVPDALERRQLAALQSDLSRNWKRPLRQCLMPLRDSGRRPCHKLYWGERRGSGAECPACRAQGGSRTWRYCQRLPQTKNEHRKAKERLGHRVGISKRLQKQTLEAYERIVTKHQKRPTNVDALRRDLDAVTPAPRARGPKPGKKSVAP